ncbi:L,D-transpeptidase [Rugosimonospora acidiphila]|uniref:L,D-transpeptidase n=1 Tax=Rugosimonospora acidiphila TaxID=556531 RepID=UPI0031EE7AE4
MAALCALALTSCGAPRTTSWFANGKPGANDPSAGTGSTITAPADKATNVPASTEISFAAHGATLTKVVLTDAEDGQTVDGVMRAGGSSWVPEQALRYDTKFTVALTSTEADGTSHTHSSTFTTMSPPDDTVHLESQMGDGQQYGVGAPIVLNFSKPIPAKQRAAVQRRLFVQTTPAQQGSWNWFSSTEVHYRPKDYWQPGTKISLRALFGGLPLGNGLYGDEDITVDASIVPHDLRISIDDKTKRLTVTQDGQVVKTMPVSMGKTETPSSSGQMVVMTRNAKELFDSTNDGIGPGQPGYYREVIDDALRLTWGGQYIHSAPWSVSQQGVDDISHGCTNLNPEDAQWLFDRVHVGDPVTVQNTGAPLNWGDGWTDWNRPWSEYVKDSAIPQSSGSGVNGLVGAFPTTPDDQATSGDQSDNADQADKGDQSDDASGDDADGDAASAGNPSDDGAGGDGASGDGSAATGDDSAGVQG